MPLPDRPMRVTMVNKYYWPPHLGGVETVVRNLSEGLVAETGVDYISIGALTHSARAVDIGLDFESASLEFYREQRARTADPLEAAFLDQMTLEEKEHFKALKDTRYYLTDPAGWFIEKERAGLEGAE